MTELGNKAADTDFQEVPPIISVDDHVVEPRDLWQRWLPASMRESAPKIVRAPYAVMKGFEGGPGRAASYTMGTSGPETDFWVYEDTAVPLLCGQASAGLDLDETGLLPTTYDQIRPGCYDPVARLADMDINGVERSLCFPTFPRFCGQTFLESKDKDQALHCVRAYNEFMVEEWCGGSGGRLIPLCIIPLWDPQLAAAEVRRNADRGVRAVTFSELPARLGLPSIHDADRWWDPFFAACDETGTVLCIHIGSGSSPIVTSPDAPSGVFLALLGVNAQLSLYDWLLSDTLERFPNLKIALSEAQIGWMPYVIEQADRIWSKPATVTQLRRTSTPPSELYGGRIFGCFFEDEFGVRVRDEIGVGQITFESDYPHQDGTWPDTRSYARRVLDGLSAEDVYRITRGNAIELFQLEPELQSPAMSAG